MDRFAKYTRLIEKLKSRYAKNNDFYSVEFWNSNYFKFHDMAFKKYILQES